MVKNATVAAMNPTKWIILLPSFSWCTHAAGKDRCAAVTRAPHARFRSPARLSALSMRSSGASRRSSRSISLSRQPRTRVPILAASFFKTTPPQTSMFSRPFGARQTVTRSLSAHFLDQAAWRRGQPGPHLVQSRDEGSDVVAAVQWRRRQAQTLGAARYGRVVDRLDVDPAL